MYGSLSLPPILLSNALRLSQTAISSRKPVVSPQGGGRSPGQGKASLSKASLLSATLLTPGVTQGGGG